MTTAPPAPAVDAQRLEDFMSRAVADLAAAESAVAGYIGDRLGLYRALADVPSATAAELAAATGTHERLVLEWLRNQTAGGYVEHRDGRFRLPPEQALALADDTSPVFLGGAFEILASVWADTAKVERAFRGDGAIDWGDHDHRLYHGVERFYGPAYRGSLVQEWLPALDGVVDRLAAGARVADVGCGYGLTTTIMAQAFPASTFVGIDAHAPSIEAARDGAVAAGVADRIRFEVRDAGDVPAEGFDLVCIFDALHDMGDPVAAAASARAALAEDGVLMVVEPRAADDLDDNLNPVARMFYAGSTFLCTPSALAQDGPHALGAQAGPAVLTEVLHAAGFTDVRVAAETPFNLVLEAR
ncbi:class I SAM-dependent methyltransferase [Actinomarinicola tropica]|uniref:Methyltransferase domain-containing protein n=1 Tax=Actinomarinicola tropica TaxID=2789776 RepID=A0A5Q2RK73_9ACTN|nr:class I SAM-dependent methyltransferase [Actinomarinicola tropica]QGG94260.1 methyltransferase domain-containing protein [Actinomarinicola tropica]